MATFHLTIELDGRKATFRIAQSDEIADAEGLRYYQVSTFNQRAQIFIDTVKGTSGPCETEEADADNTFTSAEINTIAAAILDYNASRQLDFNVAAFDF